MIQIYFDSPEFLKLMNDEPDVCLATVALEIARDAEGEVDTEFYLGQIDELALRVVNGVPDSPSAIQLVRQLGHVLFTEEGYRGNAKHYFDARNSYLTHVMDRKIGIPISLAVLYMAVAERCGMGVSGANLPLHFMVRTELEDGPMFVDVFNGGSLLTERGCAKVISEIAGRPMHVGPEHTDPVAIDTVVIRMLNNLKALYLRDSNYPQAIRVISRLLALRPENLEEQRDLGFACMHAGRRKEALNWLAPYVEARPQAEDAAEVRAVIDALSGPSVERP